MNLNDVVASSATLSSLMMIFYILNFNPRIPTLYKTMGPYYLQAQCNVQDTPLWEGKPHVHTRNITTPPWTAKT